MRVLVTGAAGFIGANFVHHVLGAAGGGAVERLVAVDLLTYAGNFANLRGSEGDARFRFVRADVADRPAMAALVTDERIDHVVHFAAESHVDRSIEDHAPFLHTNVHGVLALLEAVRGQAGFVRFLHVSTDEVYGSVPAGRVDESAPTRASSPYAASKAAADAFVQAYGTTYDVPVVITRACNNYGPLQFPEKLIPLFVIGALEGERLPLYGDGLHVRDWLYVEDHCRALWHVLRLSGAGTLYNVSAHEERTNREVADAILAVVGAAPSLLRRVADRPGHDRRYAIDATRLRETGWRPEWSFADGLAATVDWYRRDRAWWEAVRSGAYTQYYERMYGARLRASDPAASGGRA
jgi:dTDP-glucose 4,6-dehydratase